MARRRPLLWHRAVWVAAALALAQVAHGASLCETGRRQSPIDIQATVRTELPPLEPHYQPVPLRLANDGHTLRVRFSAGQTLQLGRETWRLEQFHFHTPGGDRIGGVEYPLAAHLLHKNRAGQLLAVVVLFALGAESPLLSQLLVHMPERTDGDHLVASVQVQPQDLLPVRRSYYRYPGSLTAPPCTEGFDWVVLQQTQTLSADQLARYRQRFADNARPVQPLHGRRVLASP